MQDKKKRTAVITGVSGFIGSYLVSLLNKKGWKVYGISVKKMPDNSLYCLAKFVLCDIRKPAYTMKIFQEIKPDVVFHLAAQSYPTLSWRFPHLTFDSNILGTYNVLNAILKTNPQAIVAIASSSAVYGYVSESEVPVKEEQETKPLHPYGVSKLATESFAYMFHKVFGLRCIIARIFNTIGPGKQGDVVGDFCKRLVHIEKGNCAPILRVGNLESRRAFIDVRDTVQALYLLAEKGRPGEAYNISGLKPIRVGDLLEMLLQFSRVKVTIKSDPKLFRYFEEPVIWGDITKIQAETEWSPQIPLKKTLEDTLNWWRDAD